LRDFLTHAASRVCPGSISCAPGRTKGADVANCMCGAPVVWKELDGDLVSFDAHEVSRGENRFAEGPDGLVPVAPGREVLALQKHSQSCPLVRN
jgi:hypothetical protein